MSKLSFRARALDACKPLPVFRCEDLPDLHEYASINRAVPQMPTGMEKEEESVCCFKRRSAAAGFLWRVFSAPHCYLRKLVQNGRHCCRFVVTTDLDEHLILLNFTDTRGIVVSQCCGVLQKSRVSTVCCAANGSRMHKEVTWPVSAPPFCWLSLC